jgi:Arc/MetJ family transcription regulator
MRMARVNITVPDEVLARAKAAGLNISRVATEALRDELMKREKRRALERYLAALELEQGPIPEDELAEAAEWADRLFPETRDAARGADARSA